MDPLDGPTSVAPLREKSPGGELALEQEFAEFPAGLKFRESHQKVLVDAKDKVGDRDVYRVVGTRTDGSALDILYFDAQSGLLLRSYTTMQSVLGGYPEETYYEDYRDVCRPPGSLHDARPETPKANRTYKWSRVERANAPVEDSRFMMPPPPPPRPAAD